MAHSPVILTPLDYVRPQEFSGVRRSVSPEGFGLTGDGKV